MRIAVRIAVVAGLALAWVGRALIWEQWSGLSDGGSSTGSDLPEARLFTYALIAVTLLAAVYVFRLWKAAAVALTLGAFVLLGFAVRAALDLYGTGGTFVDVNPGLGLWIAVAGALVLIAAARPIPYALGAGLVPLIAIALWPTAGLGDGQLEAAVTEDVGTTLTLDGDTILNPAPIEANRITAFDPDGERDREVFDLADIKSGFVERINAIVRQGDDLYATISNTGVMRIPGDGGKAQLVAVGPVRNPDGEPAGNPQRVGDFRPSRLAAAPDGSIYVLNQSRVMRLANGKLTPFAGSAVRGLAGDGGPASAARFDAPQDIAVDGQGRLYVADTGNGRVRRVNRDGKVETLLGGSAAPGCAQQGGDDPQSLDPTHCHAIEALAVDSDDNVFVATGGIPRVLALTPKGRYGVVAGTGLGGTAMGDGRAVSARLGAVNALAVGPDDDLYIGEYERALRVADPIGGLGAKPAAAPAPPAACRAVAAWGAEQLKAKLVAWTPKEDPVPAIEGLDDDLPGAADLKRELGAATDKQDALQQGGRANQALRRFGEETCGLFDGLYPLSAQQSMQLCATYLREWDKLDELSPGDDRRRIPAEKIAPLLPAAILPASTSRREGWQSALLQATDRACAIPYRWATRYAGDEAP